MTMNTFLPPIPKPQGVIMRLVYYFAGRQLGKVLTPLKVYAARMPLGFLFFQQKISQHSVPKPMYFFGPEL